jgi:hypothetical protein
MSNAAGTVCAATAHWRTTARTAVPNEPPLRHELLMTPRPPAEGTIVEIVDQIFMPPVRKRS